MSQLIQVSVVIPAYNSAAFIEKALVSVCEQSYTDFEIIISDDASTDNTLDIAEKILNKYPDISYQLLANPHSGPGGARNFGIQAAHYEWVAFLDSDDYWSKDKLAKAVVTLQSARANIVFHNEVFFQDNDTLPHTVNYVSRYDSQVHPFLALFRKNFLSPSSILLAKSLLLDAGLFDTQLHYGEDYDLWLKISLLPNVKIQPLDEDLTYYFVRSGSLTSNTKERLRGLLLILERYREDVLRLSSVSTKELRYFKGIAYSRCGWAYCKQGIIIAGFFYIIRGLLLNPRVNLLGRLIKK